MTLQKNVGFYLSAIILAAGLALTGCGGGSGSADPANNSIVDDQGSSSSSSSSSSSGGDESSSSSSSSSSSGSSSGGTVVEPVAGNVPWIYYSGSQGFFDEYMSLFSYDPDEVVPSWGGKVSRLGLGKYYPTVCLSLPSPLSIDMPSESASAFSAHTQYCAYGFINDRGIDPFGLFDSSLEASQVHFTMVAYIEGVGQANYLDIDNNFGGGVQTRLKLTIAKNTVSLPGIDGAVYTVSAQGPLVDTEGWHTYQMSVQLDGPHQGTVKVYADGNETPLIAYSGELPQPDPYVLSLTGYDVSSPGTNLTPSYMLFGRTPSSSGYTYDSVLSGIMWTPAGAFSPGQLKGKIPVYVAYPAGQDGGFPSPGLLITTECSRDRQSTQCNLPGY